MWESLTKFKGIGSASSVLVLAVLASMPATAWMTVGFPGKVTYWILTRLFSLLASKGLVILNVGEAKVSTLIDQHKFDGSWESAEKLVAAILNTGRQLTKEEEAEIDGPVIDSFRKFASFARQKR